MSKQTAVEWMLGFIEPSLTLEQKHFFSKVIEQAKAMEREQIIDAYNNGDLRSADLYYNETYGGDK